MVTQQILVLSFQVRVLAAQLTQRETFEVSLLCYRAVHQLPTPVRHGFCRSVPVSFPGLLRLRIFIVRPAALRRIVEHAGQQFHRFDIFRLCGVGLVGFQCVHDRMI